MNITSKPAGHGILLLNKPQGITSNKALMKAKHLLGIRKAGHTGSLDPLATGMLPICFGEATKVCQYLLDADKCYKTTGLLGIQTTTSDSMGEIIKRHDDFDISDKQLNEALASFKGMVHQIPSMYSALKHRGKPLYHYARKGQEIERKARAIHIFQLDLDRFDGESFDLTVTCSKGTYIRNLVEDIGALLGVGAHLTLLHREYTGGFKDYPMYTLEDLEEMTDAQRYQSLIPMDMAIDYLPKLCLSDSELVQIRQGKTLQIDEMNTEGTMRLYDSIDNFVGIGVGVAGGFVNAKRLLAYTQDQVV